MKAEELNDEILDDIFVQLVNEWKQERLLPIIISTRDLAKKLWEKHRVPIIKQHEVVKKKIREWWNRKPWIRDPLPHKKIRGIAVSLSSPMAYDYCILETRGLTHKSLIAVYTNQKRFQGTMIKTRTSHRSGVQKDEG